MDLEILTWLILNDNLKLNELRRRQAVEGIEPKIRIRFWIKKQKNLYKESWYVFGINKSELLRILCHL